VPAFFSCQSKSGRTSAPRWPQAVQGAIASVHTGDVGDEAQRPYL